MPLLVEQVLKASEDVAEGWRNAFLISAAVSLVGGQIFLAFGSGKNQNYGAATSQPETEEDLLTLDSNDDVFIKEENRMSR